MRRRTVLAGAAAWLAAPALRPVAAASAPSLATILESSGLAAETGLAVVDLASGQVLEAHQPDHDQPPGSVAKIVTALWGLDALGPDYRFRTEIRGTGPVVDGNLHGDLVLAGGGDPLLDTDALGDMVRALRACGLAEVRGRFLVADGALPAVAEVDPGQPADAAYNPAISGMNLNFNRVFLAWSPGADGPDVAFSAPGARFEVPAAGFAAELVGAGLPRHRIEAGQEILDARAGRPRWQRQRLVAGACAGRLCRRGLRRPGGRGRARRCRRRRWRRQDRARSWLCGRVRRSTRCSGTCSTTRPI